MNQLELYSKFPVWAQNVLCSVKGYMLDRERYGGEYRQIFDSLLESDKWSPAQIEKYKTEQLKKIITYAYDHCPFYKRWYDSCGVSPDDFHTLEDIKKFPVLTKEMVRENWRDMVSDEFTPKDLIMYHTSGSTGKALDFYWTKHSVQFYWAVVWRGRHRFGIKRGDPHFNFTGKLVVPLAQKKPPYWRYNKPLNQYMINMQHLTAGKIGSLVDLLNGKKPRFFVGYPSIIHTFATLIEEQGLKVTARVEYIFSSAEKMYDFQREVIERVFPGVKVVEHYGFSENAASASKGTDMLYHEDFELGYLELKDPVEVPDGMSGEMLATGFQNHGMPFIRYSIGDTATFDKNRPGVISDIEGRNEDYILTPEGTRIKRLDYIYKDIKGIREGQVIQEKEGEIIIKIVKAPDADTDMIAERLRRHVKDMISPSIKTAVEFVDAIPRTKAGKFKAVLSQVKK